MLDKFKLKGTLSFQTQTLPQQDLEILSNTVKRFFQYTNPVQSYGQKTVYLQCPGGSGKRGKGTEKRGKGTEKRGIRGTQNRGTSGTEKRGIGTEKRGMLLELWQEPKSVASDLRSVANGTEKCGMIFCQIL